MSTQNTLQNPAVKPYKLGLLLVFIWPISGAIQLLLFILPKYHCAFETVLAQQLKVSITCVLMPIQVRVETINLIKFIIDFKL